MTLRKILADLGYLALRQGISLPRERDIVTYFERSFLRDILFNLGVNCIIDVGANDGTWASRMRDMGYKGQIVSFEPIISEYEKLKSKLGSDSHWRAYNVALGAKNEVKKFNVIRSNGDATVLSSFLTPSGEYFRDQSNVIERVETIEIRPLDSMIDEIVQSIETPAVFLKIDTQGYDLEVLKGAKQCIQLVVALQSELSVTPIYEESPHYLDALSVFEKLGFSLMNLSVVSRSQTQAILEYDCVMARMDRLKK
jgi:FkbM family methyltransferase